jgi:hypothetical protein
VACGARAQRLATVEALCGHFTGIVDAHQASAVVDLAIGELAVVDASRWKASRGRRGLGMAGIQPVLQFVEQTIG